VHRWLAIAAAFVGVLIMVRPGAGVLDPASVLALASAAAYAAGQTLGRPLARELPPVVIALGQNTVYLASALLLALVFNSIDFEFSNKSLMFLAKAWVWPAGFDLAVLFATGILAAFSMILFVSAYKSAESTLVAPFEYSAMIWAIIYGLVLFGDFPDSATWTGGAIVVIAGILMILRDRQLDRSLAQTG
jgi:drug/metabolite transporter (DMT)-like permease